MEVELEQVAPSNNEHTTSSTLDGEQHNAPAVARAPDSEIVKLSTWKFSTIFISLCSACFLAGYDSTCVATLAPTISDEFNSLNDVSWYGIAYSLASCATILSFGKFYTFYSTRVVFASALLVFVIGSIICATAQSSIAFIVGRAVAGLGNAGIFSGCNIIATRIIPLRWRPFYQSFIGSIECIALATAPLLAGAIADVTSWRVCFWISVPLGIIPITSVLFFLRLPKTDKQAESSPTTKLRQLDPVGMTLFVPLVICFTLALQTGGTAYPWSSKQVIVPLALTGAFLVAFTLQQAYMQEHATLPARLLKSRIMLFSIAVSFACSGALYVFTYYLPIYYQAIRDVSTMQSGVRDLSRMIGLVIAVIFAGAMTSVTGYYMPYMILGGVMMSIGAGLTTTFNTTTSISHIIVYQAIFGLGCGLAWQQPYIAVQTATSTADVPSAIVVLTFGQLLGGVVMLAISQNIFAAELISGLATKVPGLDANLVLNSGVLSLREVIPSKYLTEALSVYNDALVKVFYTGMAIACVTTFGALGSGWRSVKQADKTK